MFAVPAHLIFNLISDLDGAFATKISQACFSEGEEGEFQTSFFRLWGRVVRTHYNCRTTMTTYYFVTGDDLDLFNTFYPEAA